MARVSVYSRPTALAKMDLRSPEGRLLARVRGDLTRHVGGTPSAVQRALIDQAAMLQLHVAMMDARALGRGGLSARDARQYLAWANALSQLLRQLGLRGTPAPRRSPAEHMAGTGTGAAA
jgi:hypothetical protein